MACDSPIVGLAFNRFVADAASVRFLRWQRRPRVIHRPLGLIFSISPRQLASNSASGMLTSV
jgi:hypothetical protein